MYLHGVPVRPGIDKTRGICERLRSLGLAMLKTPTFRIVTPISS